MAKISLAVKYRPKDWDSLVEQSYIKTILENQIKTDTIKNAYLFCGGAGTGKTTTARIFANKINNNEGNPVEIDAASNNGVEQIRTIIDDAKFKPLDSKYKVYILDEVHMLSQGSWNALLKLLEEPPKTTVFIMATTDPQKIPATILSRVQRYDFSKISQQGIVDRLKYIIECENNEYLDKVDDGEIEAVNSFIVGDDGVKYKHPFKIVFEQEALDYISKVASGGMRDAISMLDKCLSFDTNLTVNNVVNALGISDYEKLDELLCSILSENANNSLSIIENVYMSGKDLKQFVKQEIQFILDVCKYLICNGYDYIQIPNTINLNKYMHFDYDNILKVLDKFIKLNNQIKYETNPKMLIESELLLIIG